MTASSVRRVAPARLGVAVGCVLASVAAGAAAAYAGAVLSESHASVRLLVVLGAASLSVLAFLGAKGRLLEPLGLLTLVTVLSFVGRPLQFLIWREQFFSNNFNADDWGAAGLTNLQAQEIVLFVQARLVGSFDDALARTLVACLLFFGLALAGYAVGPTARVRARLAAAGGVYDRRDPSKAVLVLMAVGFAAQLVILAKAGGVASAAQVVKDQSALHAGFKLYVCAAGVPTALLIWGCWSPPWGTRWQWVFGAIVVEDIAFAALTGSRTLMILPALYALLAWQYEYRRISTLRLATLGAVVAVAFSAFLAVRTETGYRGATFQHALQVGAVKGLDPRTFLNDNNQLDNLLMALAWYGKVVPHENGETIVNAVKLFNPIGEKAVAEDVAFRKLVWQDKLGAGRPYTAIGGFYADFGWAGIVVGSFLLGVLTRAFTVMIRPGRSLAGHRYRAAVVAIATFLLYNLITTTYSITLGLAIEVIVPFAVALAILRFSSASRPAESP